jgi:hypothetical protein
VHFSTPGTISVSLGEIVNVQRRNNVDATAFVQIISNGRQGRVPQRSLGPIGKLDAVPPAVAATPAKRSTPAPAVRNNYGSAALGGAAVAGGAVAGAAAYHHINNGGGAGRPAHAGNNGEPDFCAEFQKDPLPVKICKILCIPIVLPLWCLWQAIICRPCIWCCNAVILYLLSPSFQI